MARPNANAYQFSQTRVFQVASLVVHERDDIYTHAKISTKSWRSSNDTKKSKGWKSKAVWPPQRPGKPPLLHAQRTRSTTTSFQKSNINQKQAAGAEARAAARRSARSPTTAAAGPLTSCLAAATTAGRRS